MLTPETFAQSEAGKALARHGFHPIAHGGTITFHHKDGSQVVCPEAGREDGPDDDGREMGDGPLRPTDRTTVFDVDGNPTHFETLSDFLRTITANHPPKS